MSVFHDVSASADDAPSPRHGDPVDHPDHYNTGRIEVIAFLDDQGLGFSLGNAVKYISRAGKKNPSTYVQDLEKARWYLDHEIQRAQDEDPSGARP